jgi:hypothetical protein
MCFGFWAGLVLSAFTSLGVTNPICDALLGSGVCYLLRAVFVYACEDCAMNLPEFNETLPPEVTPEEHPFANRDIFNNPFKRP